MNTQTEQGNTAVEANNEELSESVQPHIRILELPQDINDSSFVERHNRIVDIGNEVCKVLNRQLGAVASKEAKEAMKREQIVALGNLFHQACFGSDPTLVRSLSDDAKKHANVSVVLDLLS